MASIFLKELRGQIKQVLLNVLQNSIDSFSDEGEIIVSLAQTTTEIILEVKDTGHGIEKETINLSFILFTQLREKKKQD